MYFVKNPAYGVWDTPGLNDDTFISTSAVGSLASRSKNLGDGGWCVRCLHCGHYTWLGNEAVVCPVCGLDPIEVTNRDVLS